ncbi:MAG: hypothetical protein ACI8PW_000308 [Methylophilaceae bacterium]|jgi:uncharacterized protein YbaP (TraB family)
MFHHFKKLLIGLASFLLLSTSLLVEATGKGLFWQVEAPNGTVSYLFGTIHTDDNRVTDFSRPILDALKAVDLFVMETQPNSDPANFMMAEGSLKDMLNEAEMEQVKALTDFHVMHLSQALTMKPWLLAVVFSQSKPQTPYAQDNLLMRGAEDFNKPVKGLETSEEHFSVIDSFSLDEQLAMLRATLNMTEKQKVRDFEKLLAVYMSGDSDKIIAVDTEITSSGLPKVLWEKMRAKLLDDRNTLMANRAIALAQNQSIFVAVGAAHLAGENGFINMFKNRGYKLRVVKK